MTRQEALEVAKQKQAAHKAAGITAFFASVAGGSCVNHDAIDAAHGYQHGWFVVEGHSFSEEELTGESYDAHQGGWAWV